MILIEENPFSKAEYDPQTKTVHFRVTGVVHVPRAKLALDEQLEFAEKHQILGIVTDISELESTISTMAGYLATEYFPPLLEQGLVCNAIVVSREIFHQIAAKDLIKRIDKLGIHLFHELDDARSWVQKQIAPYLDKDQ